MPPILQHKDLSVLASASFTCRKHNVRQFWLVKCVIYLCFFMLSMFFLLFCEVIVSHDPFFQSPAEVFWFGWQLLILTSFYCPDFWLLGPNWRPRSRRGSCQVCHLIVTRAKCLLYFTIRTWVFWYLQVLLAENTTSDSFQLNCDWPIFLAESRWAPVGLRWTTGGHRWVPPVTIGGPPVATAKSAETTAVVHRWSCGGPPVATDGLQLVVSSGNVSRYNLICN